MGKSKLFSPGETLRGLGEHVGNPERYDVDPTYRQVAAQNFTGKGLPPLGPSIQQPGGPGKRTMEKAGVRESKPLDERITGLVATVNVPPEQLIINSIQVLAKAVRLDIGLAMREDIMIANLSDSVIWINTSSSVGPNNGLALAASNPAGGLNGAVFTASVKEIVKFWGIAVGGSPPYLVVVIEAAGAGSISR